MKNENARRFARLLNQQPSFAMLLGMLVAMLLGAACIAVAQTPVAPAPTTPMSVPSGYEAHESVDVGGRMTNLFGSRSMYDTLVNLQSGPRVQAETFELHALPGAKKLPLDDLHVFATGFGGDPNNVAKLDFSKAKWYEFSGMFRRDRTYFDYDLLGNPGIPLGYSTPIGPSTAPTGSLAWPQVNQSPFLFNTVRRMTDTSFTLMPLSVVTYRFGYSQNVMQGPTLTPSGNSIAGQEVILQEYQRNSTDDFLAGVDWKPVQGTRITFEEQIDHYRGNSTFGLAPQSLTVQEADGTKVALLDSYQQFVPYGYSTSTGAFSAAANCNATSMVSNTTILTANPSGGLPIIDPACNVISSYARYQPTRVIFPTEILRVQSSTLKNIAMNGDLRYTDANMNLPNFFDQFQGLNGTIRSITFAAKANAKREVMAIDYGVVWQVAKKVSVEDQITYSNTRQPGANVFTGGTDIVMASTTGQTINSTSLSTCTFTVGNTPTCTPAAAKTPNAPLPTGSSPFGTPFPAFFGQKFTTNDLTVSWDATPRASFSLTYRYQDHLISEGQGASPHNIPIPANNTDSGQVTIHENGAIVTAALRPTSKWNINGSVEAMYNDNAFTPMGFRQLRHYRIHTIYRPKTWATVSGAFNDLERHNNTNNNQNFPGNTTPYYGPLNHVDHSRVFSLATELFPNDRYGFDFSYSYNDVYMADNVCFQGESTILPGGTLAPAAATPTGVLCGTVTAGHGANNLLFLGRDFEDAPSQFVSAAFMYAPNKKLHSNLGYRISDVNGSRFFTDAGDVNGALVSKYQTPFVNLAWTMHTNLTWKGEYDYFGYGEGGGQSGAQYCNNVSPTSPTVAVGSAGPVPVVACSTVANTAMSAGTPIYGFTSPRNFHANNLVLGVHYQF